MEATTQKPEWTPTDTGDSRGWVLKDSQGITAVFFMGSTEDSRVLAEKTALALNNHHSLVATLGDAHFALAALEYNVVGGEALMKRILAAIAMAEGRV